MLPWPGAGAHIPAWPDMHMTALLAYTAVRDTVHANDICFIFSPTARKHTEVAAEMSYLITPL